MSTSILGLKLSVFFFFNDTATTEIYTLSLHDALPISRAKRKGHSGRLSVIAGILTTNHIRHELTDYEWLMNINGSRQGLDRKSTRLNSSHANISYAVFCLKKKKRRPAPTTA